MILRPAGLLLRTKIDINLLWIASKLGRELLEVLTPNVAGLNVLEPHPRWNVGGAGCESEGGAPRKRRGEGEGKWYSAVRLILVSNTVYEITDTAAAHQRKPNTPFFSSSSTASSLMTTFRPLLSSSAKTLELGVFAFVLFTEFWELAKETGDPFHVLLLNIIPQCHLLEVIRRQQAEGS